MATALFMTFFLLTLSRSNEFEDQAFTSRLALNETSTFRFSTFQDCHATAPDHRGGAIFMNDKLVSLGVADSFISSCRSDGEGGGLYVRSRFFSMNATTGFRCIAGSLYGYCVLSTLQSTGAYLQISESSAAACSSDGGIFYVAMAKSEPGAPACVHAVNSSFNNATAFGSGLCADPLANFSLQFCTFTGNFRSNCLVFLSDVILLNMSCLRIVNNTCHSEPKYPGLICVAVHVSLAFVGCVIQGNTIDFLLGGRGVAKFDQCVFDQLALATTGAIMYQSTDCTLVASPTQLSECLVKRPLRTATPAVRPAETVKWLSVAGIVGGALSCVVILAVTAFVIVVCVRRRGRRVPYGVDPSLHYLGGDDASLTADLDHITPDLT